MTPLQRLIQAKMTQEGDATGPISVREAALRSKIDHNTLGRLLNGTVTNPHPDNIQRLADWLGISITRVREAAGRPPGEVAPFPVPAWLDELGPESRKALLAFARVLHDQEMARIRSEQTEQGGRDPDSHGSARVAHSHGPASPESCAH